MNKEIKQNSVLRAIAGFYSLDNRKSPRKMFCFGGSKGKRAGISRPSRTGAGSPVDSPPLLSEQPAVDNRGRNND